MLLFVDERWQYYWHIQCWRLEGVLTVLVLVQILSSATTNSIGACAEPVRTCYAKAKPLGVEHQVALKERQI